MKENFIYGFIFLSQLLAQPPDFPDTPDQGPIGGFALLAVAGAGLVLKKLYNRKK